jgi:hypothetical protein
MFETISMHPPSMIAISIQNFLKIKNSDALYLFLFITRYSQDMPHEDYDISETILKMDVLQKECSLSERKFIKALQYLSTVGLNPFDEE